MKNFVLAAIFLLASPVWAQEITGQESFDQKMKESLPAVNVEEQFGDSEKLPIGKEAKVDKYANKTENEIPLDLNLQKASGAPESPWMKFTLALAVVGLLGIGLLVMTRKYAVKKNGKSAHGQIQMLTQFHLGPKKSLAIVRVAGESILIGISEQNINLIKSLALLDEEIPDEVPTSFKSSLNSSIGKAGFDEMAMDQGRDARDRAADELEDEFSISGIRDVVKSKLKGLRG